MNGAEILTKFTADTSDVDKKTNNFTASLGKLTKAFTMGQLAAKAISKAISIFNASLDDAIKRQKRIVATKIDSIREKQNPDGSSSPLCARKRKYDRRES